MSSWFYQINPKEWDPQRFRIEIWENERWSWPVGRAMSGREQPRPGDSMVFFYTPSGGTDPGFYGWAVILEWYEDNRTLYFRPATPTNHLKMHPWWNDEARKVADEVRGKMKQGTLWRVPDKLWERIRTGITTWVGGRGVEV